MAYTPIQPDSGSQTGTPYKAAIEGSIGAMTRLAGVFAPHEQDTPDMTVRLEAGALPGTTAPVEVAAQSTGTITAPTTHPRIDRVVIDALTGAVSVIPGAEASSPVPPDIPTGKLPNCQVTLATTTTVITNDLITDERVLGGGGGSGEAFPVGAIYLSVTGVNPATELGYGTWSAWGSGRMPVGIEPGSPVAIAAMSKAALCVVTWNAHGFVTGDKVLFEGITQADWTAINGLQTITYVTANGFSIPVNTLGFATYNAATDPGTYREGSFVTVEQIGGSKRGGVDHTHIIPSLSHSSVLSGGAGAGAASDSAHAAVATGVSTKSAQEMLNPYIVVYMWKRVS